MESPLQLYAVFHLNLAYSAVEEEQRPEVLERCYWPLLRLARELNLPLGIEASGYTLETVQALDPAWVEELRVLVTQGDCEFIGSGYAQIIGPLVPAPVNAMNLRLGHEVYEQLLGIRPRIALVNEQAYAAGLVQHYLEAGYRALIMEWNNPAHYHPEWDRGWLYAPQWAGGVNGEAIPVIWNHAIAFQKFQRFAHREMELAEYLDYLAGHLQPAAGDDGRSIPGALSLYGNDVEIFDFRPGRYHTEPQIQGREEWQRLGLLFRTLRDDPRFHLVPPSRVLALLQGPQAPRLHLESPEQPIPVKKQPKYNITRWAVTGRDDLGINTACWRLYRALEKSPQPLPDAWRTLCYLWSSDFRTHITARRWSKYQKELRRWQRQLRVTPESSAPAPKGLIPGPGPGAQTPRFRAAAPASPQGRRRRPHGMIRRQGLYLDLETDAVKARFNCRRGLALEALSFPGRFSAPLLGTLPHGYYEAISLGADYYSGHNIVDIPAYRRVTDLNPCEPRWRVLYTPDGQVVQVQSRIPTELGPVHKRWDIYCSRPRLELHLSFSWPALPLATWRTGILTLIPGSWSREFLYYQTHNGGYGLETFPLAGRHVDHTASVSALISASHGLGGTGGVVILGDGERRLRVGFDQAQAAVMPMLTYQETGEQFFCRLLFSLGELDETRRLREQRAPAPLHRKLQFSLSLELDTPK
ncbi:MAG: glycoside hydrolase family 57 [Thermodesulfobacteriota bacterium]